MNTIVFGSSFSNIFVPLESNKLKIMKFTPKPKKLINVDKIEKIIRKIDKPKN